MSIQDVEPHPAGLFENARTHGAWLDRDISEDQLRELYDRLRWAPTSVNCNPARIVFLKSREAKLRLKPCLSPQNIDKTMAAPVCAIVAADSLFFDLLPQLLPGLPVRSMFADSPQIAEETARRNTVLQGGYLILAARSLGIDCGPMSGFDRPAVDREFFPDGRWKSEFLVNLGYGDAARLRPRSPRLSFDEACLVL